MRCLYCGEPLSLLRKLTGKAEFCSEAHREAYQEEFNSLALQRLASQPTNQRRHSPLSPPPPDPVVAKPVPPETSEPFGGLPFPDDAEDLEPIFDPDFATSFAEPPPPEPAPPPMRELLPNGPPPAAGETPPSYSFPLWLEEYPRQCLMTNGIFPVSDVGAVPFSGYVDLPEPMDDEADLPGISAQEGFAPIVRSGWALAPASSIPSECSMPSAIGLAELPLTFDEDPASPTACALAIPETQRLFGTGLTAPVSPTARHQAPLAFPVPFAETDAYAIELETFQFDSGQHPWNTVPSSGSRLVPPVAAERELACAAALADDEWAGTTLDPIETGTGLPIPECESFDAERSLVPPQFVVTLQPSIAGVAPLELLDLEPGPDHSTREDSSAGPLPFAAAARAWTAATSTDLEAILPTIGLASFEGAFPAANESFEPVEFAAPDSLSAQAGAIRTVSAAIEVGPGQLGAPGGETGFSLILEAALEVESAEWTPFATAPLIPGSHPPATLCEVSPVDELAFLEFALQAASVPHEDLLVPAEPQEPAAAPDAEPLAWTIDPPVAAPMLARTVSAALARVRVKDFAWPEFAAGCESLFTPDQPFRFHEIPFVQRGITDTSVGSALECDIIQGLMLPYADDRFEAILHPGHPVAELQDWLQEESTNPGTWPKSHPAPAAHDFAPPAPAAPKPASEPSSRPADPPSTWQQAARAMYEGEQQVPRDPHAVPPFRPEPEAKHVTAVPVITEPLNGTEIARVPPPEPPAAFVKGEPPEDSQNRHGIPSNEQPQFERRREQPQAPHQNQSGSTVSVNTTIVVDGNADGVVVENAIRVSLGQKNKKKGKEDAIEKFAEGEDLDDTRVKMAPPEDLPGFVAEAAETRAILQPITPLSESIQWPKFSVTPMRRRIAFGPPARGAFFGGSSGAAKTPPPEARTLPPKKSVGYLFKKLTNS